MGPFFLFTNMSCLWVTSEHRCLIVNTRHGVMVICNSNSTGMVTIVQVIVIDGTERNVIVIESKAIVIELLLCYYN